MQTLIVFFYDSNNRLSRKVELDERSSQTGLVPVWGLCSYG